MITLLNFDLCYKIKLWALFCFLHPPQKKTKHHQTKFFESKFPSKVQTSLINSETFSCNRKLTSIRINFLNKIFFTHFDKNNVLIHCFFVTQNSNLLMSSSRMCGFIVKNSANKVCISIPNCHIGNKIKLKALVCIQVFLLEYFQ